jgi:hypothetical protein
MEAQQFEILLDQKKTLAETTIVNVKRMVTLID